MNTEAKDVELINDDIRATIDTAVYTWEFLEQIDEQDTNILRWGLKRKMRMAKKQCLMMLFDALDDLYPMDKKDDVED